nr:ATP-binding protein [Chthonobacter albigriseus]
MHAQRKVEIEMAAAMEVARNTVQRRMEELTRSFRPQIHLEETVTIFDGDRHVQATLVDRDGGVVAQSRVPPPENRVPDWFLAAVAPSFETERIDVPSIPMPVGAILLVPDPRSEVDEVWADVQITLTVLASFFIASFGFVSVIISRSLKPIGALAEAYRRIGAGDYSTRLPQTGSPELAGLCQGYNEMAERLGDMAGKNRQLAEQLVRLQDEERAELARDLHDEVGPFLFAVDVDSAAIAVIVKETGGGPRGGDIAAKAASIKAAASHARLHVRGILGQLRPGVLGSLGLAAAVREIVDFHRSRRPDVAFALDVPEASYGEVLDGVILAVIREALSNAIKHAEPRKIEVSIVPMGQEAAVVVVDDGRGFDPKDRPTGYGLIGMRERVAALGGMLAIERNPAGRGTAVNAIVPLSGNNRSALAEAPVGGKET